MLTAAALFLSASLSAPGVTWHQGTIETALAEAGERETLAAIYFWRNGSDYCAEFYQNVLGDPRTPEKLAPFVVFSAQHGTEAGDVLFEKYGITSLPSILFVRSDGKVDDIVAGYAEADTLLVNLERIHMGELTVTDLEHRVAEAEKKSDEQFELRYMLAVKYYDLGNEEAYVAGLEAMQNDDKRGRTKHAVLAMRDLLKKEMFEGVETDEGYDAVDPKPLLALARKVKHPEGRLELLGDAANMYAGRGQVADASKTFMTAYELVPDERMMNWAGDVAYWLMNADGERSVEEKEFVMELASRAAELASREEPCGCDEDCECRPPSATHAYYLATLANAYRLVGNAELAKMTAERSVGLDTSDECRERVAHLL